MDEVDYEQLVIPDGILPSDQNRKLKRLKKASEAPKSPLLDSLLQDDELKNPEGSSKSLDSIMSDDELPESEHRSAGFEREKESEEFDELFPKEGERTGAKRALDFDDDDVDLNTRLGLDRDFENQGLKEIVDDKKANRKRVKNNGGDEEKKERKNKKKKDDKSVADGKPKVPKRKVNQERKAEVEMLVDYQRQLRERRDVAFKPLPVIQKPVSSVLERIRQRKQQVSIKAAISISSQLSDPLREIMIDSDSEESDEVVIVKKEDCKRKSPCKDQLDPTAVKDEHLSSSPVSGFDEDMIELGDGQNSCKTPLVEDKEPSTAFRQPTSDTQDLFTESQACDMQDDKTNAETGSSQDEELAPSLPSMNLKLDSAPFDDISSEDDEEDEEEENDKENINPLTGQLSRASLSPKGDPVRKFVDEEALEDDCSDDDRRRFEDEGEDVSDAEELAELIATNYTEKPVDREKRNALHQSWLAQQDEAGTENLLQRLIGKTNQKKPTLLDEEDEGENTDDELSNEEDVPPTKATRMTTKRLIEMLPLMFTEKDDGYVSSDDEETERRLDKQRLLGEVEMKKHMLFTSSTENEISRGVCGRIKKLNSVPDTRKKMKTSSFFQNLVTKGSDSNSSKSSFLSRMSSIPVTKRRASNTVKAYIFGRDDSNSKSSIPEEDSNDTMNQVDTSSQRKRTVTAKFSSQTRQITQSNVETSHNTSLFDILKRSSVQTNHIAQDNVGDDVIDHQAAFAAFKPFKRPVKVDARS